MVRYERQNKFLVESFKSNKLAHSYILVGPKSIDKKEFAVNFIKFVNCQHPGQFLPCDKCDNCLKINKGSFIDFKIIEEDLSIAKIRELKNELIFPPYQAEFRFLIVNNAEQIKEDAASVLLKTLEEPKKRNVFFLLANSIYQVLPTIKSRCQVLKFTPFLKEQKGKEEYVFEDFLSKLKNKTIIEKFSFVKNLEEEKYFDFLEEAIKFFQNKVRDDSFRDYSKKEMVVILKNFKKTHSLINKTNTNPRLALENTLLNT
jgi:DNA polymerase III delta prime subunit